MRWDAVEIARFARGAGFAGEAVTTATAVALATSGGVATFDHRVGFPGVGHYVGLWGIDVDRWPEYAGADLHVPHRAATAAHELVEATGGWAWAPVWGTSHFHAMRPHAGVTASQELHHQTPVQPFTLQHTDRRVREAIDGLAATRAMLATFHRPGRPFWRPITPSPTNDR